MFHQETQAGAAQGASLADACRSRSPAPAAPWRVRVPPPSVLFLYVNPYASRIRDREEGRISRPCAAFSRAASSGSVIGLVFHFADQKVTKRRELATPGRASAPFRLHRAGVFA